MVAAPARPHAGQHRLDQRHRSEKIAGEKLVHFGLVRFLNGGAVAVTGIVDEHIHSAELGFSLSHGLRDLCVVGHVQHKRERRVWIAGGDILDFRAVARGDDRVPSAFQHRLSKMAAEPA